MAKLTYAARKKLMARKSLWVFPAGTKADKSKPKFPIHDVKHARAALSRAAQSKVRLTGKERCKVVQAVCRKYPEVGMCATGLRGTLARCGAR
jgi:hypothetical protein